MRIPFLKLALLHREYNRRKKLAKLNAMATKENRTASQAAAQSEEPSIAPPHLSGKIAPQSKSEGSKYVGVGLSRSKSWVRRNSEFGGNPYRRWRLRWRGNLYGERRKISMKAFTKMWGKYSLIVGGPPLLLEGL